MKDPCRSFPYTQLLISFRTTDQGEVSGMTTRRLWLAIVLIFTSSTCLAYAQTDDDRAAIKRGNDLVAQAKYEAAIHEY